MIGGVVLAAGFSSRMGAFKPIEAKAREHVCNLYKGI